MKSSTPTSPFAEFGSPFLRRCSLFVHLGDAQARLRRLHVRFPRRAAPPRRHDIIDTLRQAELADWQPDLPALRRFPSL